MVLKALGYYLKENIPLFGAGDYLQSIYIHALALIEHCMEVDPRIESGDII